MTIVKKKQNVKKHLYNSVGGAAPKIVPSVPSPAKTKIKFGEQSFTQKIKTVGSELFRPVARITRGATKLLYQAPAAFIAKRKYNTAKKAYIKGLTSDKSQLTRDITDDGHKLIIADVERSLQKYGTSGMQSHEAMKKIIESRIKKYKSKTTSNMSHNALTNKILEKFKGTNSTIDNPMYKSIILRQPTTVHSNPDVQALKTAYTNTRKNKGEQINKLHTLASNATSLSSFKSAYIKGKNLFRSADKQIKNTALNTYNKDVSADITKLKDTAQSIKTGVGSAATYVSEKTKSAATYVSDKTKRAASGVRNLYAQGINEAQRFGRTLARQSGITKAKDLLQNYSSASNSEKTQIAYQMEQKLNAGKASYDTLATLVAQSGETTGGTSEKNKLNIGHDLIRSGIEEKINNYTKKIGQSTTTDEEKQELQTKLTALGTLKARLNPSQEMVKADTLKKQEEEIKAAQQREKNTQRSREIEQIRTMPSAEKLAVQKNAATLYNLQEKQRKNERNRRIREQSRLI